MSFGIYLYRYHAEADRDSVRAALARWGWDGSDGSPYQIGTGDGVTVELYATGLDDPGKPFDGGTLEVRGFSRELCRLVLDLAHAGRFTISHDDDPSAVILFDEGQRAEVPAEVAADPKLMICRTPEELEAAIEGGFDAWRAFRDRACGPS